jgi:glycosyltransferase involved in cell wall biosynthesis
MVFPSMFEGLGLPLLEALHHRLPVVAARATCIPEVVGEAGLLFDPTDVDAIAAALLAAHRAPEQLRAAAELGVERLELFSWERNGALLSACYKHVLALPKSEEERAEFARATRH